MIGLFCETVHEIWIASQKDYYCARSMIAILGYLVPEGSKNPFSEDFRNNLVEGKGITLEPAIEKLKAEIKSISNSLWT